MKKSFKNALLALALIAAGTGAYANMALKASNKTLTDYNWIGEGPDGDGPTFGDRDHAVDFYGCDGGGEFCALGVNPLNSEDTITLLLND